MRNDIYGVSTVLAFQVMGWKHDTCHHLFALTLHEGAYSFQF